MTGEKDEPGLAGLVIGVPAARRASETAKLIERWGGTPLVGPTVEEVPVGDESEVLDATRDVIASAARWSVHLTGVGTRRWFDAARRGGLLEQLLEKLGEASLIPRGQKASSALKSFGLGYTWIPPGETSKEIAEWLAPQVHEGDVVALQRHGEPVPGLSGALENAGARIVHLVTYRWELPADPRPGEELVRALVSRKVQALVITSAPQVRHLFKIAGSLGLEDELRSALDGSVYLAAVGTVAASALEERNLSADLVAEPARLGALVRELAAARDDVLRKTGLT